MGLDLEIVDEIKVGTREEIGCEYLLLEPKYPTTLKGYKEEYTIENRFKGAKVVEITPSKVLLEVNVRNGKEEECTYNITLSLKELNGIVINCTLIGGVIKEDLIYVKKRGRYILTYEGSYLYNNAKKAYERSLILSKVDKKDLEVGVVYSDFNDEDVKCIYLGNYYIDQYKYTNKTKELKRVIKKDDIYLKVHSRYEISGGLGDYIKKPITYDWIKRQIATPKTLVGILEIGGLTELYLEKGKKVEKLSKEDVEIVKGNISKIKRRANEKFTEEGYHVCTYTLNNMVKSNTQAIVTELMSASGLKLV